MSWYLDSNELLVHDDLPEPIRQWFSDPYPASFWNINSDNFLTLNSEYWSPFPEPIEYLTPPYPATMWYMTEDNEIENDLLPDRLYLGAFCECTTLSEMKIPQSVKSIGERAFYDTNLIEVTIARDCTFYPTSFPVGCQINYYEEE